MNPESSDTSSGSRPVVVCVIGSGRSGTSMTMRILNLLGVYIGPDEELVPAGPGGPAGFWEHHDLIRLDDRLLRSLGGSWRNPPLLEDGWERAAELDELRAQGRELLERTFAGRRLWGWKDPRVSLTTAFWLGLVPDLRFVICLRNPIDSVASLSPPSGPAREEAFYYARRAPKGEQAYWHWLAYVAGAIANTSGRRRLIVSYEEYFTDRRATVERLARFVGLEPPSADSDLDRRIGDFVDDGLRHHQTPPEDVLADEQLPRDVASLYLAVEQLRALQVVEQALEPPETVRRDLETALELYARRLLDAREPGPGRSRIAAAHA